MSSQKTQKSDGVGDGARSASDAQTSEGLTDRATVEALIASQERARDADTMAATGQYECLDCGTRIDAFPTECPDCGSTSFETNPAHEGTNSDGPAKVLFDAYAELSAPYNPYVPR